MAKYSVESIYILGLHDQFDVHLSFDEGLNIIYGKNGRGKTTILHVLANVLERDFSRFLHLQFNAIFINFSEGYIVSLDSQVDAGNRKIQLQINEEVVAEFSKTTDKISAQVSRVLDGILGPRPVYLPAFRSILERTTNPYRYAPQNDAKIEYEQIVKNEYELARARGANSIGYPRRDEQHHATAAKTLQCRQWFGDFVPIIRYPSLSDVDQRLSLEFRQAQLQMASVEQKVFSASFTRVFDALASVHPVTTTRTTPELLREVAISVGKITSKVDGGDEEIYSHILTAVRRLYQEGDTSPETTNRVLALYAELLKHRSDEQDRLFSKIEEFEQSVNKFLDGKELEISGAQKEQRYFGPFIRLSGGRKLRLSSLSSGERQVLTMIFCASRMSHGQGLFLVDEPELSLHVDWQRDIIMEVARQAGGRQVIACTHSPEVGADNPDSIQFFEPEWSQDYLFGDDVLLEDDLSEESM
ncbi:AAA family ATPase [Xanthomonas bonasiae]|uniref:AAA family ATPase n=1 Tax=Xanthomonas bonasiae TaxID=2810351 RepID=UPI00177FD4B0|nr:AAA family ATPase [Xanthomonas surreyensis]MBD7923725.1 AAA family ATPase [Xanthomonas surreyensis]